YPPRLSDAFLTVEYGSPGLEPDRQRSKEHDGKSRKQHANAHHHVEAALQNLLEAGLGKSLREDHPARAQRVELYVARLALEEGRQVHDTDSAQPALEELGGRKVAVAPVSDADDDLVDPMLLDQGAQSAAISEESGLLEAGLPIPALHEAHEVESGARAELLEERFHAGGPGSAAQHQYPALQGFVAYDMEEHLARKRREDEGEEQAQRHQASAQDHLRHCVEDDCHRH